MDRPVNLDRAGGIRLTNGARPATPVSTGTQDADFEQLLGEIEGPYESAVSEQEETEMGMAESPEFLSDKITAPWQAAFVQMALLAPQPAVPGVEGGTMVDADERLGVSNGLSIGGACGDGCTLVAKASVPLSERSPTAVEFVREDGLLTIEERREARGEGQEETSPLASRPVPLASRDGEPTPSAQAPTRSEPARPLSYAEGPAPIAADRALLQPKDAGVSAPHIDYQPGSLSGREEIRSADAGSRSDTTNASTSRTEGKEARPISFEVSGQNGKSGAGSGSLGADVSDQQAQHQDREVRQAISAKGLEIFHSPGNLRLDAAAAPGTPAPEFHHEQPSTEAIRASGRTGIELTDPPEGPSSPSVSFEVMPPEAGRVWVHLSMVQQTVYARVVTEQPDVQALLVRHQGQLESQLQPYGLSIGQFQVQVGQQGQGQGHSTFGWQTAPSFPQPPRSTTAQEPGGQPLATALPAGWRGISVFV